MSDSAQSAETVGTVYLLLQKVEKRQSVVSVHATRESAELRRHEGDVIQKWGVWDLVRLNDGTGASE